MILYQQNAAEQARRILKKNEVGISVPFERSCTADTTTGKH